MKNVQASRDLTKLSHAVHITITSIYMPFTSTISNQMNISATFSVFKLFRDPALCLPHSTISTFNHLPIPLSKAFVHKQEEKEVDIRAVVLDKDNCFATPKKNIIYSPYKVHWPCFLLLQLLSSLRYLQLPETAAYELCRIFSVSWSYKRMVSASLHLF